MLPSLALLFVATPFLAQEPGADAAAATLQAKVDEITPRVEEIRGLEFVRKVPAGVQTPEQFLEYARREFDEEIGEERFRAMSHAYILLGLVEPGTDLYEVFLQLLQDQVGGYYDPKTEAFYMISSYNQGMLADIIMAHELTHALDDQHYDLDGMQKRVHGNADAEFAMRAVVEGSGTSVMTLYMARGVVAGWLDMSEGMDELQEMMEEQAEVLEVAPPYLVMTLALPYLLGNQLLTRSDSLMVASATTPAPKDLDHAFREPPLSSEQVLHFEKYWDPEKRDDPVRLRLPDFSGELGEGWEKADEDVLGELGCYVLTEPELPNLASTQAQLTARWTNEAASGWDGDLYQYYQGPGGAGLLLWASVWDSPREAAEFAAALEKLAGERNSHFLGVHHQGDAVVAWFANEAGAGARERLEAALRRARPDWFSGQR